MTPDDPSPLQNDISPGDLRGLRLLRTLVTVLTLTMILAGVVVIWLFVTRFPDRDAPAPMALPDTLELPAGATVLAVTRGTGWWAVVIRAADGAERIEVHGPDGLRQSVPVEISVP